MTNPVVALSSRDQTDEVVEQLASLRDEMSTAMLAISGDSIGILEESLWKQEVLCVSLKRLLQTIQGAGADAVSLIRIQNAMSALHQLNQTYANLVQQSRAQADVLYGLCQSYRNTSLNDAVHDPLRFEPVKA